jgi:hypothetical protein
MNKQVLDFNTLLDSFKSLEGPKKWN